MTAPTPNPETLARELAALGEDPPSPEELAMLAEAGDDLDALAGADDAGAIASVARLTELAEPLAFDDLSELETHRSWRAVEQRLANAATPSAKPKSRPAGAGPRRWLLAAVGVAAAAAVLLVVVRPGPAPKLAADPIDPAEVAELGAQARTSLATLARLDGDLSDTQRAERLAAEYQRRLEEHGG